ncbi:MAG TPA: SDR family NAD(P)-dependent oxidoreductase [Candidatus Kryptobacter bacterium]|nr:SDR family NAD(P)-dependent oxidoreductase [Candidatus Kryptobacter bacterium]
MIDLTSKVVLITGGSRGIGAATAILFAKAGADVAITYQGSDAKAKEVVNEIKKLGKKGSAYKGDNSKNDVVKSIVHDVHKEFGRIDILVNNAGIWTYGEVDTMKESVWDHTMDINLKGTFLFCHYVIPIMKKQGGGSIINLSSTAGQRGEAFHSHYAASKGGVISFTKSLSTELGQFNIRVNSVAPGWVDTDMSAEALNEPAYRQQVLRTIPLGKIPTGSDIAGPILFLASDLASHITGEILNVNGGSVLVG